MPHRPGIGWGAIRLFSWPAGTLLALLLLCAPAGRKDSVSAGTPPQPASLRILFTASTNGYIGPCDCGSGVLGGLDRRAAAFQMLRRHPAPVLLFDLGNLFEEVEESPPGELAERQARFLAAEISRMGYHVFTLGARDLAMPSGWLAERLPDFAHPPVLTNAAAGTFGDLGLVRSVRISVGGLTIEVLNIIDPDLVEGGTENLLPWRRALEEALAETGPEPADLRILVAHLDIAGLLTFPVEAFPQLDVVLYGSTVIPRRADRLGGALVMGTGANGQYIGVLDLQVQSRRSRGESAPAVISFEGRNLTLEPDFPADKAVADRMERFRMDLVRRGLIPPW